MTLPNNYIIVVGGGLAGLTAAHQILLNGGNVVLIDKQAFFGGNSTKATSGINGAVTRTQIDLEIKDSVQQFYEDTVKSAKDKARPDLIRVLTYNSAAAVEWLQDIFDLDLTLVSRLGGHSQPRTHRGHDAKFPGMAITYALMEKIENLADSNPERVAILKKSRVTRLIKSNSNKVTGLEYEHDSKKYQLSAPVVLATGGYAADFTSNSLLKKYRPDVYDLPSTNGVHATGDGQKMVIEAGGGAVDLDKVQVHPTGLVDPRDPDNKWKFLAAEALRGEGGLMLNSKGNRFCDELGTRDYVSGEMFKTTFPIRLLLNKKASDSLDFHTKHYAGRGLMKKITGKQLAEEIGCGVDHLNKVFSDYNDISNGKKKDPYGKKFFLNGPVEVDDDFYVALITPVLHFTMGGVSINDKAEVLDTDGKRIDGLFAAGELAGGVHGANRLGGSSLLGCVVYGRVSADTATSYLLQQLSNQETGTVGGAGRLERLSLHIDPSAPKRIIIDWSDGGSIKSASSTTGQLGTSEANAIESIQEDESESESEPISKPSKDPKDFKFPEKEYTVEEVSKHNTKNDCWVILKGAVLNVTSFLENHPGGVNSIVNFAGKDASEEFEMLHEDRVIPKYAGDCVIGRIKGKIPDFEF